MKNTFEFKSVWAIYDPTIETINLTTLATTRAGAIRLSGAVNPSQWKSLYKLGARAVKVDVAAKIYKNG